MIADGATLFTEVGPGSISWVDFIDREVATANAY
jgi:hypothetical protein